MSTPAGSLVGETVAERYKVLSELGSGGFGAIYMATHVELNNPVAIKVLHGHLLGDESNIARFRREATATSRLRHSAIASVFDVGVLQDGRPYMVMEYLSGKSLADIMEEEGALPVERVLPLFMECCDALRYAHRQGLLHRDIKPDNIFVVRDMDGVEHAKLLDFGLAKIFFGEDGSSMLNNLTETGTVLGTPWYMSPEQCQALPLDGRTDIYSLAYSLYEALAGRKAFNGTTHYEVMRAHVQRSAPPINEPDKEPVIPAELQTAVLKALAKAPNDRFATAEEFKKALLESLPADSPARAAYRSNSPVNGETPTSGGAISPTKAKAVSPKRTTPAPAASADMGRTTTRTIVVAVVAAVTVTAAVAGVGFWCYENSKSKSAVSAPTKASVPEQNTSAPVAESAVATPASAIPATATSPTLQPSSGTNAASVVPPVVPAATTAQKTQPPAATQLSAPQVSSEPAVQPQPNAEQIAEHERLRKLEEKMRAMESTQMAAPAQTNNASDSPWPYGSSTPLKSTSLLGPSVNSNSPTDGSAPPNYNYASGGTDPSGPPGSRSFPGMPPGWRPGMPLPPGVSPPPGFPPAPQSMPGGFPPMRPDGSSN